MKALMEILIEKIDKGYFISEDYRSDEYYYLWGLYYVYHDKTWYALLHTSKYKHSKWKWKFKDDFDLDLFKKSYAWEIEDFIPVYIIEYRNDQLEKLGL